MQLMLPAASQVRLVELMPAIRVAGELLMLAADSNTVKRLTVWGE
jgi:hypothetical protein